MQSRREQLSQSSYLTCFFVFWMGTLCLLTANVIVWLNVRVLKLAIKWQWKEKSTRALWKMARFVITQDLQSYRYKARKAWSVFSVWTLEVKPDLQFPMMYVAEHSRNTESPRVSQSVLWWDASYQLTPLLADVVLQFMPLSMFLL